MCDASPIHTGRLYASAVERNASVSHPTTTTQENTEMTTTNTLGAIGDLASNQNVTAGTVVSRGHGGTTFTYREPLRRSEWRDSDGGGRDFGAYDYYIVSHPEQPATLDAVDAQATAPDAAPGVAPDADADWKLLNERLLEQCRQRGWCSDFDRFVRDFNRDSTTLKLTPSRRNVHVSFRLRIEDSNGLTDDQIRAAVREHANGHLIRGEVLIDSEAATDE